MNKNRHFNIYQENLQHIVYKNMQTKNVEKQSHKETKNFYVSTDKPIPKPAPEFWKYPLSYGK